MRFRNVLRGLAFFGLLIGLASPVLAEAESAAEPSVDFSVYSSYAWLPLPPGAGKSVEVRNPTAHKIIQEAVDQELSSKGLSITRATPDLYVTYEVHREAGGRNLSATGYSIPTHFAERSDLAPRVAGTLVVDVIDAQERKLVWRGWTAGAFSRAELLDYRAIKSKVGGIVAEVLSKFPPEPGQP